MCIYANSSSPKVLSIAIVLIYYITFLELVFVNESLMPTLKDLHGPQALFQLLSVLLSVFRRYAVVATDLLYNFLHVPEVELPPL